MLIKKLFKHNRHSLIISWDYCSRLVLGKKACNGAITVRNENTITLEGIA